MSSSSFRKRETKCINSTEMIDLDLSDLFPITPEIENRFLYSAHFSRESKFLEQIRCQISTNPITLPHDHCITLHAMTFLNHIEKSFAYSIAATGHLPLMRKDCHGYVLGSPTIFAQPPVTDVNDLASMFRDLMKALIHRDAESEGRPPPQTFSSCVKAMVAAINSMSLPDFSHICFHENETKYTNMFLPVASSSSSGSESIQGSSPGPCDHTTHQHFHIATASEVDHSSIAPLFKFEMDRLLLSLRQEQNDSTKSPDPVSRGSEPQQTESQRENGVAVEIATGEKIFSGLGGNQRRTTFRVVKFGNTTCGRESDTAKFSGGLLGPYTPEQCTDFDSFKKLHHRMLNEPSLKEWEVQEDALVMCLSYRHKSFESRMFEKDRLTDLDYRNWFSFCSEMTSDGETLYFWQDQKSKGVASDDDLDWISTGVLPYINAPVVLLRSEHGKKSDENRLWMTVEAHLGKSNCGMYIMDNGERSGVLMEKLINIAMSEKSLAARVLHGCFEGKHTYHENDRLKMIRWAISKLVKLSPRSESSFADIDGEATINGKELKEAYICVLQETSELNGTQVEIKKRRGLVHQSWEDMIPVFESARGNVAGGVSVRDDAFSNMWRTEYHVMGDERKFYYMRYEMGNHRTTILTGEVEGVAGGGFIKGRVVRSKKVFSHELLNCFVRFGMRLAIFDQERNMAETALFYLFQKHDLVKMIVLRVLKVCWGVNGNTVAHLLSSEVEWKGGNSDQSDEQ